MTGPLTSREHQPDAIMQSDPHSNRFLGIDGTRGIGALLVMAFHFTDGGFSTRFPFPNCLFVLDYFWCVSGFVLAYTYGERLEQGMPVSTFMARRLARFMPTSLIGNVMGIAVLLSTSLAPHGYPFFIAAVLSLLFLPTLDPFEVRVGTDVNPDLLFPINAPLWSLSFEFAVNWIYGVSRPRTRALVFIVAISFFYFCLAVYHYETPPGPNLSDFPGAIPRSLFSFFSGVLVFQFWRRFPPRLPAWWPAAACVLLVLISVLPFRLTGYIASVAIVPLIVWSCTVNPNSKFERKLYAWLGDISYPVYALHFPIVLWVHAQSGLDEAVLTNPVFTVLLMLAVMTLATIVAKFVELPLRRRLYQRLSRKQQR